MKENKMRPKRIQRNLGSHLPGKNLSTEGTKAKLSQSKPAQVKPFAGKLFYLDLPTNRTAEKLEGDIQELGGMVEKFFSKEIKYLVSNKREARYVHCLRQDSPVPSPESGPSSPHPLLNTHRPNSHGDTTKTKSQGQTETCITSRGKSLVEKVVKEQERVKMNKILSNALEWGVKILYLDDILAYVQRKKKTASSHTPATAAPKTSTKAKSAAKYSSQRVKGGRINRPFIKVEDSSRHYRPIYISMPNIPEFNLKTVPPYSPFCVEDKNPPMNKHQGHSDERAHGRKKNRDKKRGGYCECCLVKYENLTMHLQSDRHRAFSKSDEYLVVDQLVSMLPCNLIHFKSQVKRPKCSVSSPVLPRTYGKTDQRHEGGLDITETFKDEQHLNIHRKKGFHSGLSSQTGPAFTSAPPICRDRTRKSSYTPTDKSKHKPLGCKKLCRQNSLTSSVQKVEQTQISLLDVVTDLPRGETRGSVPTGVCQSEPMEQFTTQDRNSSSKFKGSHGEDKEFSKKNTEKNKKKTHQQEDKQDSPVCWVVPSEVIGVNFDEEEMISTMPNSSPVRKIKRKVKVYVRKRRKIDSPAKHVKPTDCYEDSLLKLIELFQDSDDMDEEFLGF